MFKALLLEQAGTRTVDNAGQISLQQTPRVVQDLLAGKITGRMIANLNL